MSHSPELIRAVQDLVEVDYPPAQHVFVIERAIPGTRMFPDILVKTPTGEMVCVVEIGYTRPEKLTRYRELGIPDVRWYDKAAQLHTDWETRHMRAVVKVAGAEPAEVAVYRLNDVVACHCVDEEYGIARLSLHPDDAAQWDELYEAQLQDVWSVIITDYVRYWFPAFCDKCGESWLVDGDDTFESGVIDELRFSSPRDFGLQFGARELMPWHDAVVLVEREIGVSISVLEGATLYPDEPLALQIKRSTGAATVEISPLAPSPGP